MVQIPTKALSLEEFLQQPETEPASEYINGQVIQKPMPQGKHSTIQGELVNAINAVTKPQKTALAFPELRCTFGGRSIVPDVAVFTWGRIPLDASGEIANTFDTHPDWTIEILSPDQSQTRVTGNILHCLNHGTQLGWLIDPAERSVLVYPPGQQPELLQDSQDLLLTPNWIADLHLTIEDLFGWLKLGI
ncbi:Uma2 family endonuclease [Trichocoleus sp. FACHB-591]|uniref:Uma2 family endonuclease n=1 Tax=Trichocoleus sp. FACHB-591 TaxID=2692872 RepID=UPI0016850AA5|nr:Uma2 family endonuclease [Trichocoleus sp. FACHB-591]MBD2097918.1 Uma2 family endonuclease [Trichocoleus sp. FACHB-591]